LNSPQNSASLAHSAPGIENVLCKPFAATKNSEPLAHSAHDGVAAQTYRAHVSEVCRNAVLFAEAVATFSPKWRDSFTSIVRIAAIYHDLGKLDEFFQDILRHNRGENKGFNHCDAGTAFLLQKKLCEAALLVFSHHIGFPSVAKEMSKNANGKILFLRDTSPLEFPPNETSCQRTDRFLADYLNTQNTIFQNEFLQDTQATPPATFGTSNLTRRLALSCIVDADHGDTAQNYKKETPAEPSLSLLPVERLAQLDRYVAALPQEKPDADVWRKERQQLRQKNYEVCRNALLPNAAIVSCDSPVGTGKTTAVMAHLLRVAAEKKLRRIFVVLPYTSIIDQSVDVYRKALVLDGEDPERVVAAHHHKVEFSGENAPVLRLLSQRWDAPIVVTTAVQFFETLAAKDTTPLRKFHQVPGAAVFIDEAHAAMPAPLWPQMWLWLAELADKSSCHFVLASGSLATFWKSESFVSPENNREVPRLLSAADAKPLFDYEKKRVSIKKLNNETNKLFSIEKIADAVLAAPGPRLIIFNTVQSAAAFALHLRDKKELGKNVEHLSTALSPADRNKTLERVKKRLKQADDANWVLVATSCVEAGIDISFHTGFRERASFSSLLQLLGRVSRNGEYTDAVVYDFQHDASELLTPHPHFKVSARILGRMLEEFGDRLGPEHCTQALEREINDGTGEMEITAEKIKQAEKTADFPTVAKLCRLITADTHTVLVNQDLIARFQTRDRNQFPNTRELMMHSVQVWDNKFKELPLTDSLGFRGELYGIQPDAYDDFIGYMRGYLNTQKHRNRGTTL
jgi:CRISPR-associated endonuclease/helicase Cas3